MQESINNDWKSTVTSERRLQLINNLMQAMTEFQMTDTLNKQDLFKKANCIEKENFEKSTSRSEYYYRIAEQIYQMGKSKQSEISQLELEDHLSNMNFER